MTGIKKKVGVSSKHRLVICYSSAFTAVTAPEGVWNRLSGLLPSVNMVLCSPRDFNILSYRIAQNIIQLCTQL
jgi:hypothetical protein